MVEIVNRIISKCKNRFGKRYKYFLTGSKARNENKYNDYDIAIYDTKNDSSDWEMVLSLFKNQKIKKPIDAQITQYVLDVIKMNGKEIYKNRNKMVKRYIYSKNIIKNSKEALYKNISNNLWEKTAKLVSYKHRAMGLDKIKRIYIEL